MSYNRLMAWNSFASVNNSLWIGIPKVATTSLYRFWNKKFPTTYYNNNKEFLESSLSQNQKNLWCIWKDPWERWLSAVMQDYEIKMHIGQVHNGIKEHKILSKNKLEDIANDIMKNWRFGSSNLRNKSFQHSSLYLTRYLTLLWYLANEKCNCPTIEIYSVKKINEAIKKYFNKDFNNIFFNQSNKNNTLHLETILKENKFYEKWQEQFQEDIKLNETLSNGIKTFTMQEWKDNIIPKSYTRIDNVYRRIKLPQKFN